MRLVALLLLAGCLSGCQIFPICGAGTYARYREAGGIFDYTKTCEPCDCSRVRAPQCHCADGG